MLILDGINLNHLTCPFRHQKSSKLIRTYQTSKFLYDITADLRRDVGCLVGFQMCLFGIYVTWAASICFHVLSYCAHRHAFDSSKDIDIRWIGFYMNNMVDMGGGAWRLKVAGWNINTNHSYLEPALNTYMLPRSCPYWWSEISRSISQPGPTKGPGKHLLADVGLSRLQHVTADMWCVQHHFFLAGQGLPSSNPRICSAVLGVLQHGNGTLEMDEKWMMWNWEVASFACGSCGTMSWHIGLLHPLTFGFGWPGRPFSTGWLINKYR